jgi:predicted transposase/invertase (TIGR01784 family)
MEHRVRRIYLDEIEQAAEQSIGVGVVQLVVESKKKTGTLARQLINKARQELPDASLQQQIVELIETIVLYKFPNLSREELEAMLGLSELRQTRVYQEAREEGRQEGLEQGLEQGLGQGLEQGLEQAKLEMVPWLLELGINVEEIAQRLELDIETIRQIAAEQTTASDSE